MRDEAIANQINNLNSLLDIGKEVFKGAHNEREYWIVGRQHGRGYFLENTDFRHDVRLYIDGDFKDDKQRSEYAHKLAKILNKGS